VNRRHWIKLAALSLASLIPPTVGSSQFRSHAIFKDMFGDDRLAAHLGEVHQERDSAAGARGRALAAELKGLQADARQERLQARRQRDFETLDIVTVDGWVMARSEADLCAAVHLDRRIG
jgi:hypothetical protein